MNPIQKLVVTGLLCAVGVVLPILFHLIGGMAIGTVLLPIHLPVLLAGVLVGWQYGLICAIVTPFISFLVTGMPMLVKLPYMMAELICYGVIVALVYKKSNQLILSLITAQITGRLLYACLLYITAEWLHLQDVAAMGVWGSFVTGLPGIILQLVLIPIIVSSIKKERCL